MVNNPPNIIPDTWPDSMEEYKIKLPSPTLMNFNDVHPLLSLPIIFTLIYLCIANFCLYNEDEGDNSYSISNWESVNNSFHPV